MDEDTKRMFAFAAMPAVAVVILALLIRAIAGGPLANFVFWNVLGWGGIGAMMGFISGRISRG